MHHRPLSDIGQEILADWKNAQDPARGYAMAIAGLHSIDDQYGLDSAVEIVARFLGTAGTWKGPVARRVKTELKGVLAMHEGELEKSSH